jgi:hypothetical protein
VAIGLLALAALLALGTIGWGLTGSREGPKGTGGAVAASEGGREGGALAAPEGSGGAREGATGGGPRRAVRARLPVGASPGVAPRLRASRLGVGLRVGVDPRVRHSRVRARIGVRHAGCACLGARRIGTLGGGSLRLARPRRGGEEHRCRRVGSPGAVPVG